MAGVSINPQLPEAMLVMFTIKRLVHHLTVKFVKNQSGIHDVLRTHGKYGKIWYKINVLTSSVKFLNTCPLWILLKL